MRILLPAVTALLVGAVIFALWTFSRVSSVSSDGSGVEVEPAREVKASRPEPSARSAAIIDTASIPGWIEGRGVPVTGVSPRVDGLPNVIGEIEALCLGRSPQTANTIQLKQKLLELVGELDRMSEDEKSTLAEYFRNSDQPAVKFHLMVVLGRREGAPFVDAVADYYESEPHMVAETLQYMLGRTPRAANAFERLLEDEVDPIRREMLLSRASFVGSRHIEPVLQAAFAAGPGTVDRRAAVTGLARIRTENSRAKVWEVIDGPYEAAGYDVSGSGPSRDSLKDLRGVAVAGILVHGEPADQRRLLDRWRDAEDGDSIADYVADMWVGVPNPEFVPDVVEIVRDRREVPKAFLSYLGLRAKPEHLRQIEGLLDVDLPAEQKAVIRTIAARLR